MKRAEPDVIVVGAGAAGLFAARSAALNGASVLVLEKTSRIGTKILISGGGKCNVAHNGPLEEVIGAFSRPEAVFLRPACYRMPNTEIIRLVQDGGIELYTRDDGRVFPINVSAKEVLGVFLDLVNSLNVRICLNTAVDEILVEDGHVSGLRVSTTEPNRPKNSTKPISGFGAKSLLQRALMTTEHEGQPWDGPEVISCQKVIVCCGGSSYPNSGTTGDGYKWMRALGHTVVKPRAALAPIYLQSPQADFSGISYSDIALSARQNGKKVASVEGALLWTHQGVSGPAALELSGQIAKLLELGEVSLEIDFFPRMTFEKLRSRLDDEPQIDTWRPIQHWVLTRLWDRPTTLFLDELGIKGSIKIKNLSKRDGNRICERLKAWNVGLVQTVPLEKGEVTAGGVDLSEVDSKTMKSKKIAGLYLAGEILDIAGPVGGYNLQAAFATGHVAGESAALER